MPSSTESNTCNQQSHGCPGHDSPDSRCPICLDSFDNMSHLDRCLHRFCFCCIQEWAKTKAECPLCKQRFHTIIHSVRAEDDFKEYVLRPTINGSFASPDDATRSSQRSISPIDNGILFEGISNQTSQQREGEIHQMIRRLASRRQAGDEGRSVRPILEQELINFRRALYRSGVRVRNIQNGGRYRNISAEFYRRNPACLHRLKLWLKRELTVLYGAHDSSFNIVEHFIMSYVTCYDMESQAFAEDLRPFLFHYTDHFLHEFFNFSRSPYNIEAYDHHANYDYPPQSNEEGSHSESSVNTISTDKIDTRWPDVTSSALGVGQAPWDDETPGPSYSISGQTTTTISTVQTHSEKPSGKRKYKACHLEKEAINEETHDGKGKEEHIKAARSSLGRHTGSYKNDLAVSSCNEPKKKRRRKARSPSE